MTIENEITKEDAERLTRKLAWNIGVGEGLKALGCVLGVPEALKVSEEEWLGSLDESR